MLDKIQNVTLDKDFFSSTHSSEEGQFLWRTCYGDLRLITIVSIPAVFKYGQQRESYYGVAEHRNKNVTQLNGSFMKLEVF